MPGLAIRADRSPEELRVLAKGERDARVARRLLAIANALSGMSRAAAAQSAGMDRQTLRDWALLARRQRSRATGQHHARAAAAWLA